MPRSLNSQSDGPTISARSLLEVYSPARSAPARLRRDPPGATKRPIHRGFTRSRDVHYWTRPKSGDVNEFACSHPIPVGCTATCIADPLKPPSSFRPSSTTWNSTRTFGRTRLRPSDAYQAAQEVSEREVAHTSRLRVCRSAWPVRRTTSWAADAAPWEIACPGSEGGTASTPVGYMS